jgi:serine phosphatase RsbU (regulator of sigma subunit)/anti-sigma regulatory factor (Ser/Thr protein kinase)
MSERSTGTGTGDMPLETVRAPENSNQDTVVDTPVRLDVRVEIADHDPLMGVLLGEGGPVELDGLNLESPSLKALRAAGVHIVVPLVAQGELIGTLNLGRRLSDQPYSTDDRRLLAGLASQVAPAIRVAQLVRQQEAEATARERIEQELRVAALIQQTLLPKELPTLPGWEIDAYYRPARAVGGDFYDFIPLSGGKLGIVVGDVTDKGVPAALVMATTRSTLRAAAQRSEDPGRILAEANEVLVAEIPPAMFVTCLVGVLEPVSGRFVFANAGHNLPYVRSGDDVRELRATGMPLGLMPGMPYDVVETTLEAGDTMLLTSDGIAESHSPDGEMFGLDRLVGLVGRGRAPDLVAAVLAELDRFCGPGHEQEDDVTMVVVRSTSTARDAASVFELTELERFTVPSEEGNEREVMERVATVARSAGLDGARLQRLETAVAEATMNAIEHGNRSNPDLDVQVTVLASPERLVVRVEDHGGGPALPQPELPDLDAKLTGEQSPRGWGLFLIERMVDELRVETHGDRHVLELEMTRKGDR